MRHLGLDRIPYSDRLKTENWDVRPNKINDDLPSKPKDKK